MKRRGRIVRGHNGDGIAVLDDDAAHAVDDLGQTVRIISPIHSRCGAGPGRIRAKACRFVTATEIVMRVRSEAHEGPDNQPPRLLDCIVRFFPTDLEFRSCERCQPQQFDQPSCSPRILQTAEQIDDVVIEIVIDLSITALFPQQHRRRAAERLDINAMRRKVRDDPRPQLPLAAVPAKDRT